MKKIVAVLLVAFLSAGCAPSQKKNPVAPSSQATVAEKGGVSSLTALDFKKKVMDYEAHPQEWVFEGSRPAVIDFYATWCGPCKMMSPIVERMAQKYAGKVDFYKVDIDKEQELATIFGIHSIPTFLFIPLKGTPAVQMGAMEESEFEAFVGKLR